MTAYYNEIDPYAAQWLRNLIDAGHIAPGVVDERSIKDVRPEDLRGFKQCHFFAGIGVWSHALRLAGWPDDRPVWTGSCPCQPFSAAGKGGGFNDERHLWPEWFRLIGECAPGAVFGEQVASKDGLAWLDLVHADMEGAGYAVGALDLCAAGVGAPHIRQRLFFVADTDNDRLQGRVCRWSDSQRKDQHGQAGRDGAVGGVADDDDDEGCDRLGAAWVHERRAGAVCEEPTQGNADGARRNHVDGRGQDGGLGDPDVKGRQGRHFDEDVPAGRAEPAGAVRAGPTHGHWRAADWLACRDGKWRPVEPGLEPLAHGAPARVGRLRAYGNAIVAPLAAEFIAAYLSRQ